MHSWIAGNRNDSGADSSGSPARGDFDGRISDVIADTVGGQPLTTRLQNNVLRQSVSTGNQQQQVGQSGNIQQSHHQQQPLHQTSFDEHNRQELLGQNHRRNTTHQVQHEQLQRSAGNQPPAATTPTFNQFGQRRPFPPPHSPLFGTRTAVEQQKQGQQRSREDVGVAAATTAVGAQGQQPLGRQNRSSNNSGSHRANSVASMPSSIMSEEMERYERKILARPKPGDTARKLYNLVNQPFQAKRSESRVQSSRELEQHRAASAMRPEFTPLLKENEAELNLYEDCQILHQPGQQQQQQKQTQSIPSQDQQPQTRGPPPPQPQWTSDGSDQQEQHGYLQPQQQQQSPPGLATTTPAGFQQPQQHHPSPPQYQHRHHPHQYRQPQHYRPHSTSCHPAAQQYVPRPRPWSASDYPPVYDFSRRPIVVPGINVDAHALPARYYREEQINAVVQRCSNNVAFAKKMKSKYAQFDKQTKHELEEFELDTRKQELDARRRQFEEQQRIFQEELDRQQWATAATTRPAAAIRSSPAVAASRAALQPPQSILKNKPPAQSQSAARVAFSSPPIRSVNTYSPNQSGADSSLLLPENCSPQRLSTQSQSQPQQQHRLVLTNRTNPLAQRRSKAPPSAGRAATTTTANVQAERDREGARQDYLIRWQQNHDQLMRARRRNPKLAAKSNPSAIFQRVPPPST